MTHAKDAYALGMYESLGPLIRERREALGLDQASLAAQLNVGQQAVSGWERGRSRPRRAMLGDLARVLAVDESSLATAGEYQRPAPAVRIAVRPLTRALPLDDLTDDRFEDLLADVMTTLHPDGHASRYGGRGHKQYGIDIVVAANGTNLATAQCKRHREFGPAAVDKAIKEVAIAAPSNYLFLARLTATPAARREAGKHACWELWDGEDISRYIRNLPREQAVRIVDTYFPGHRESFLGVTAPGPWLRPEEYFNVNWTTIFNHEWSLAGRQDQLDQLVGAAYQTDATLAFVSGAGGVGKTRLLKALADAAPDAKQVRILSGDTRVSAADFELLPHEGEVTVAIDDAHEVTEITGIVAGIWRRNRNAKVVLATRPYGLSLLKEGLARHSLLPMSHTEVELGDLDFDDAILLAREALGGEGPEAVARQLALLTIDSPLATVVGGVLIKQGQLELSALHQDDEVRFHIMRGFRDALVGDPLAYDPSTRRAVLDAIAALQPFRTNETAARESISAIVGKPYDQLHKELRSLENAGILRRRGDSLRIVPDLLGDVILTEAAFDDTNPLGTGYLARIEPLVAGSSFDHLFVNVSRVDWQVRNKHDSAPSLADSLWAAFRGQIQAADMIERHTLAEALAKVAYFQPDRALEVTRWLIDNPTDRLDGEHAAWRTFLATDYSHVLEALPPVLRLAAMNADSLPEALNQLWELAQGDKRPPNQQPEHALRVLQELAGFGVGKPIWFNNRIVDVALTWFADDQRLSPFVVLEPMLATEGEDSTFQGHTIAFRPYSLNPESIMRVRQRVIDFAFDELGSSNLRRSGAAAMFLKSALHYPTGRFGRAVSTSERDGWMPGFVATIGRLGEAAAAGDLDPAILVSIRDALHWHDNYGDGPTHDAAEKAIASLPAAVEDTLALVLHDGWGLLIRDRGDSYEDIEAKRTELIQDVIEGLKDWNDQTVIDHLITRIHAEREVHEQADGHPGPFVAGLIAARPSLAQGMLGRLKANHGKSELDQLLPVILSAFALNDPAAALQEFNALYNEPSRERRRSVSQAIGWNRGGRELHSGELDLMLRLAADPDVIVRQNVARAAQLLAQSHIVEATRLIAALRFGDDANLADDIFCSFRRDVGISWSNFSEAELQLIRNDLIALPEIDGYSVSSALAGRSATHPNWVIELLLDRIQIRESQDGARNYAPLPYHWDTPLRIRDSPDFVLSLTGILDWIARGPDSWTRRDAGADLFAAAAISYDSQVTEILASALASGAELKTRAVIAILRKAPRTLIWEQPDFVSRVLHAADRLGEDARRAMAGALRGATTSGTRIGTPGQPFPETIEQRDKSRGIANGLPAGSIEKQFYADMADSADRDIVREAEDDLPNDGRSW